MASLIQGFEYDIFISYRQKDNKHDGWVTEFVDNLKGELESTFKEEIGVYFDINPHDGLLETHDVDASLKDKLNCLVFIPIISRTYCDPKSFAWEHEFKTFIEQASRDQFGLKVKLPNGNVANRILPIQIHYLNAGDKALVETALGGVMRAIEFIYKEPGVNKPLTSEDDEKKNMNSTKYKIQINKVANAIDEIINSLNNLQIKTLKERSQKPESIDEIREEKFKVTQENDAKTGAGRILKLAIGFMTLLIVSAIFFYPKVFNRDKLKNLGSSDGRISIAVMPFQNLTNDTIWNVWQDGIQVNLITSLSNYSQDLKVRQIESVSNILQSKGLTNYTSITPSVARTISQKLDANVFICGGISKSGSTIRVNAQLINSKTEEALKSFQIDGNAGMILPLIDSLSRMVKNFLVISKLEKEGPPDFQLKLFEYTSSTEAYRYFIYGQKAFYNKDIPTARDWYIKAIKNDSSFFGANLMLGWTYSALGMMEQAKKLCLKIYRDKDKMSPAQQFAVGNLYTGLFGTPQDQIDNLRQAMVLDDQVPIEYYMLGYDYSALNLFDKAIPEFEKALEIFNKWGSKPMWINNYTDLGYAYHKTGQYKKEKKLYTKAEQDFPNEPDLLYRQAILSLSERDTIAANAYINKYLSINKENALSEAENKSWMGTLYIEAGITDKAEAYFRQALKLQSEDPDILNNLAYFLIDKDRNIKEGMELIDNALALDSENYSCLHTKGWGLYKEGKYKEALAFLEKSWGLKTWWDQELCLHLEAAKKTVANIK